MGNKRLSDVIDYSKHIEPYRIIEIVSGVGSGKNYWVENTLMQNMRVLLITSRKAKVEETKRAVTATAIPDAVISPNEAGRRHSKAASTKRL